MDGGKRGGAEVLYCWVNLSWRRAMVRKKQHAEACARAATNALTDRLTRYVLYSFMNMNLYTNRRKFLTIEKCTIHFFFKIFHTSATIAKTPFHSNMHQQATDLDLEREREERDTKSKYATTNTPSKHQRTYLDFKREKKEKQGGDNHQLQSWWLRKQTWTIRKKWIVWNWKRRWVPLVIPPIRQKSVWPIHLLRRVWWKFPTIKVERNCFNNSNSVNGKRHLNCVQ